MGCQQHTVMHREEINMSIEEAFSKGQGWTKDFTLPSGAIWTVRKLNYAEARECSKRMQKMEDALPGNIQRDFVAWFCSKFFKKCRVIGDDGELTDEIIGEEGWSTVDFEGIMDKFVEAPDVIAFFEGILEMMGISKEKQELSIKEGFRTAHLRK